MQYSSNFLKIFIAILLIAVAVIAILYSWDKSGKVQENPYQYDIDRFKNIRAELIKYEESQQIKIELKTPYAVAVDRDDKIYVAGDSTLLIYNNEGHAVSHIALNEEVKCIAVGPDNLIYLGLVNHIEVYEKSGQKISTWKYLNNKAIITSIAATENDIFIADAGNKVVLRYNLSGTLLRRIGEKDEAKDIPGFVVPSPYFDLAIGYEGYLWVVNPGRHALENYTFSGELRSSWERSSMDIEGFSGCCNPTHIAMLANGSFVTSEKGLVRVKIHNQMGNFKEVVAGPKYFAEDAVGLDLAVDSIGRILVLDPKAGVVRIFTKKQN